MAAATRFSVATRLAAPDKKNRASPVSTSERFCGTRVLVSRIIVVVVFALAPLAPWTIRNFRTLHHFQPLAPRYATETMNSPSEVSTAGSKPGSSTTLSVEEIYWSVPGDKIDPQKLPSRAIDERA
jgi:hypothetical protein